MSFKYPITVAFFFIAFAAFASAMIFDRDFKKCDRPYGVQCDKSKHERRATYFWGKGYSEFSERCVPDVLPGRPYRDLFLDDCINDKKGVHVACTSSDKGNLCCECYPPGRLHHLK
uniref:Uncharacterized protein n=1 Tax=Rhipicephalus appendiculatus TaxID=34631 RepID=A0A131YGM5_RHIAP